MTKGKENKTGEGLDSVLKGSAESRPFWLPPGSIRGLIAVLFVVGTFALVWKVLEMTVALETTIVTMPDGSTQKVMAFSDATLFIGVMGALSVVFTLTGIVVQHYFGNAQNADMFKDLNNILKGGK